MPERSEFNIGDYVTIPGVVKHVDADTGRVMVRYADADESWFRVEDLADSAIRVEWRVRSRTPGGRGRTMQSFPSPGSARQRARALEAEGSTEVVVESRTVTTSRRESEWKATDQ